MTGLVVITRPRHDGVGLAAELAARGYRALIEPMLEIVPVASPIPALDDYRALVFTSANGVRAFAARSVARDKPAYAVGARTADTLLAAGFADVRGASGDAQALADLIGDTLDVRGPLLHLAGATVSRDMETLLEPMGISVDRLTLYDAVPVEGFSKPLVDSLYACTVTNVLFFSTRTAATFGTLLRNLGLADMINSTSALCFSAQVAAEARKLPWGNVMVAPQPTVQSLIALLPLAEAGHGR